MDMAEFALTLGKTTAWRSCSVPVGQTSQVEEAMEVRKIDCQICMTRDLAPPRNHQDGNLAVCLFLYSSLQYHCS